MSSELPPLPPPPPRPDLALPAQPRWASWRGLDPGSMGATRIVGSGLRLWAESWLPWFVVAFVFTGIPSILIAAVDPWSATYGTYWFEDPVFQRPDPNAFAVVLGLVASLFLGPWQFVILTRATLSSTFAGPLRGWALIGGTIRGVHSILWIFILVLLIAIPFGLVFLAIAYGLREAGAVEFLVFLPLAIFLYFVPRIVTLADSFVGGGARGSKAIGTSWRLSSGAWATSAGAVILSFLIALAISIPIAAFLGEVFPSPTAGDAIARAIIQSVANAIVGPMGTAIVSVLFLELMARKDLLDQEVLRANLARFDR